MKHALLFQCLSVLGVLFVHPVAAQTRPGWLTEGYAQTIAAAEWSLTGDPRPCPSVIFDVDDGVATYSHEDRRIRVHRDLVPRLEEKFGENADDALAVILGHEIWHALRGQSMRKFGKWADDLGEDFKEDELQADLYGLTLAHFANFEEAAQVFDPIFDLVRVSEGGGYPLIRERKESNDLLKAEAKKWIDLFETSNLALISGQVGAEDFAIAGFRHISVELFGFPELWSNLGLAYFSKAVAEANLTTYVFPLVVMGPDALKVRTGTKAQIRPPALDSAQACFARALVIDRALADRGIQVFDARRQDEAFFQARLGLLAIDILSGEPGQEIFGKIQKLYAESPSGSQKDRVQLLKSVALLLSTVPQKQQEGLGYLINLGEFSKDPDVRSIAIFNKNIFEKKAPNPPPTLSNCPEMKLEAPVFVPKNGIRLAQSPRFFYKNTAVFGFQNEQSPSQRVFFQKLEKCPCGIEPSAAQPENWSTGQGIYRHLRFSEGDLLVKNRGKECFRFF